MGVGELVSKIDAGEIRLPEIQRAYVWKGPQVAQLIDSMYRRYPSGSLLLWAPQDGAVIAERAVSIETVKAPTNWKPLYLLDGQQRITSLHRVLRGHPDTRVVFHIESEKFQLESKATTEALGWVRVTDVTDAASSLFDLATRLAAATGLSADVVHSRLDLLRGIASYMYQYEVVEGLSYQAVTDIFVRVNSKGRPLKSADLAIASLSARWSGAVARIEGLATGLADRQFSHLDVQFLVRALAACATPQGGLGGLVKVSNADLDASWKQLEAGLTHTLALLEANAGITASKLLASSTALIPVVTYLGLTGDKVSVEEANGLVYWLLAVGLSLRYSAGKETRLSEDLAAVRSPDPVRNLLKQAGLLRTRVEILPEDLEGKTTTSPYFALSYLTSRAAGATDWFHGIALGTTGKGAFKLEYHHVHPRKTLKSRPRKEVNDLANLAFVARKANSKISAKSPSEYFEDLDLQDLERHFVPTAVELRTEERYLDFLAARRALLADAMTAWVNSFRPSYVNATAAPPRPTGLEVTFSLTAPSDDRTDEGDDEERWGLLIISIRRDGTDVGFTMLSPEALLQTLAAADDGLVPTLHLISGETDLSDLESPDQIAVPVGPVRIVGTTAEWRTALDRARAEPISAREFNKLMTTTVIKELEQDPVEFFVLDTD